MPTTIVIADDHKLILESIGALLAGVPDFKVVAKCANGRELVRSVQSLRPTVAVVDICMPELNGIDAVAQIRKVSPLTRTIALSLYSDKEHVCEMLDAGVVGFVIKSDAPTELIRAIRFGSRGKVYLSQDCPHDTLIKDRRPTTNTNRDNETVQLTRREREILQLIGEGHSSPEIAEMLNVNKSTIKSHRKNLMEKLDMHDVASLTCEAIRLNLVHL